MLKRIWTQKFVNAVFGVVLLGLSAQAYRDWRHWTVLLERMRGLNDGVNSQTTVLLERMRDLRDVSEKNNAELLRQSKENTDYLNKTTTSLMEEFRRMRDDGNARGEQVNAFSAKLDEVERHQPQAVSIDDLRAFRARLDIVEGIMRSQQHRLAEMGPREP